MPDDDKVIDIGDEVKYNAIVLMRDKSYRVSSSDSGMHVHELPHPFR